MVKHFNSKTKTKSFRTSSDALYGPMIWAHIHNGGFTDYTMNRVGNTLLMRNLEARLV